MFYILHQTLGGINESEHFMDVAGISAMGNGDNFFVFRKS